MTKCVLIVVSDLLVTASLSNTSIPHDSKHTRLGLWFNMHYREDYSHTAARECHEETLGVLGNRDELYAMAGHDDVFKVIGHMFVLKLSLCMPLQLYHVCKWKLTLLYLYFLCRYTIQVLIMLLILCQCHLKTTHRCSARSMMVTWRCAS